MHIGVDTFKIISCGKPGFNSKQVGPIRGWDRSINQPRLANGMGYYDDIDIVDWKYLSLSFHNFVND